MSAATDSKPLTANPPGNWWKAVFILLCATGFSLRFIGLDFQTLDYTRFLKPWCEFIVSRGQWDAVAHEFSDYSPPYLYLLALTTFIPIDSLYSIKYLSILFEVFLVCSAFHLVRKARPNGLAPFYAVVLLVFSPTMILNGSVWGQCDVVFTVFLVLALLFFHQGRAVLGCAVYSLALCTKLQAVFLGPVILILLLNRNIPFRSILVGPYVYLLTITPCLLAGRSFESLLKIYFSQAGQYNLLTMHAPNLYQWISIPWSAAISRAGIIVTGVLVAVAVWGALRLLRRSVPLTVEQYVYLSLFFALLVPFVLPKMHERYFFIADVLSILFAVLRPRRWFIPVLICGASLISYLPFLRGKENDLTIAAAGMAAALVVLLWDFKTELGRGASESAEPARGQ